MIQAHTFIEAARARGFGLYSGVPCSYLQPLINAVIDDPALAYVGAANEGEAVAIASGAELGGVRAVAMFQNSGLGNAVNPLTSLNRIFELPVLLVCTWRGEPGGKPDEPQHAVMGEITPDLFDLMGIPWAFFPEADDQVDAALDAAVACMDAGRPYAFVMRHGSVAPRALESRAVAKAPSSAPSLPAPMPEPGFSRREALEAIQAACGPEDLLVATTGYTGRTLFALADRPNQLYMVGSMGCAGAFGLGLALARPDCRVVVLDGDGAALMRLGALATIGYERPANLLHVLLDNASYDSTGGQSTVSHSVDLAGIAVACGYPRVTRAHDLAGLREAVEASEGGLHFVHAAIGPDAPTTLPRPTHTPAEVARRLRGWLAAAPASAR